MRSGIKYSPLSGIYYGIKAGINGLLKQGIKTMPPVFPFSLTDNSKLRLCCGVIKATATSVANDPITWAFLTSGGHNFNGFNVTVTTSGSDIVLSFPGKVVAFVICPDESYAALGNVFIGATDNGDGTVNAGLFYEIGHHMGTMVGNGTNWTLSNMGSFNVASNTISDIKFNPPKAYGNTGTNGQNLSYWKNATARYVGTTAGLTIKRTLFLRDFYDASGNTYPAAGVGSGASGAIKKGDVFYFSKGGTLNSVAYSAGDSVTALVDTPGQTDGNWQRDVGGGPVFGYQLITDATGVAVAANSSADIIEIDTGTPDFVQISCSQNDANGFPGTMIHSASSNFWVQAIVEV